MGDPSSIPELTAEELVRRIESGEEVHVLDVRAPERLADGAVDLGPPERFHNLRGSEVLAMGDPEEAGVPRDALVAVVCGRGYDSYRIAEHLNEQGFRAASLEGGMIGWMGLSVPRELEAPPGCDRLVQFDRPGKGALGYLLVSDGKALAVDPPRHTEAWLDWARANGAEIVAVADTHAHADYVSGGPPLGNALGVPYHLHAADSSYPYDGTPGRIRFEPVVDGDRLRIGRANVDVVHTPGHTEGSVSYRIADHSVLTGDFVFVGSIGRPDLGGKAEEWTPVLWRSLERARAEWPEAIRIRPAHYAVESERNADRTVGRPFGELGPENAPLGLGTEAEFTAWVLEKTGDFPEAYRRIKAINVGLESPPADELDALEAGRNQCALG